MADCQTGAFIIAVSAENGSLFALFKRYLVYSPQDTYFSILYVHLLLLKGPYILVFYFTFYFERPLHVISLLLLAIP